MTVASLSPVHRARFKERLAAVLAARKAGNEYLSYQGKFRAFTKDICGESVPDCLTPIFTSFDKNNKTIVISANGIGKTWLGGRASRYLQCCYKDSETYLFAAPPEDNLKILLWKETVAAFRANTDIFKSFNVRASMEVERAGRGGTGLSRPFTKGLTIPVSSSEEDIEARASGKHAPVLTFICDEGDAIPDAVYRGIDACQVGGKVRLLIFFNPRKPSGAVYRMIRNREANIITVTAFDHPNVIEGRDIVLGAVSREQTVIRINKWTRTLAPGEEVDHECFEVPEFLVGTIAEREGGGGYFSPLPAGWRKITENEFYYKVLARYPAQSENQLISRIWIDRAFANHKKYTEEHGDQPPAVQPVLGWDVAEGGGDANVLAARYGDYVTLLASWKYKDPAESKDKVKAEYGRVNPRDLFADATGVGANVAPDLKREGLQVTGVKVANRPTERPDLVEGDFFSMREQLMWRFREWLRTNENAMLPYTPELEEQCLIWEYWKDERGYLRMTKKKDAKKSLTYSPDDFDAIVLTHADRKADFVDTFDQSLHVCKPVPLLPTFHYFGAFVHGYMQPAVYLLFCVIDEQRKYVVQAWHGVERDEAYIAKKIKEVEKGLNVECRFTSQNLFMSDPAEEMAGTGESIILRYFGHGIELVQALDDEQNGHMALRNLFRCDDEHAPQLKIFRECEPVIAALETLVIDEKRPELPDGGALHQNILKALSYGALHMFAPAKRQRPQGWREEIAMRGNGAGLNMVSMN